MRNSEGASSPKKRYVIKNSCRIKRLSPIKGPALKRLALNTSRAAEYLDVSESLLRKMREQGNGPKYSKINTKIVYPVSELIRFLEANLTK